MRDRILVIDDNQDAAELLQLLLQYLGYEVQVAFNGQDGLELAIAFRPSVIISDIGMPIMNGYDVAKAVRNHAQLSDVLLIALSGWSDCDTRQRAVTAGFDRHLAKPVNLPGLESILSEYFTGLHAVC